MKDKKSWQRIFLEKLVISIIIAVIISILLPFSFKFVDIYYLSFLLGRILPILSIACIALAVLLYLVSLIIGNKTKEKVRQVASHLFWAGILFSLLIVMNFWIIWVP